MATSTTSPPTTTGWCVSLGTEKCSINATFSINEIYLAYKSCKKNKSNKISCLRFEEKQETINDVLKWNLEIMTPLETYRKLSYIIERYKK